MCVQILLCTGRPSMISCTLGSTALTYSSTITSGLTTDASHGPGCDAAKNYEQLTWASCAQTGTSNALSHPDRLINRPNQQPTNTTRDIYNDVRSPEPDLTNKYYMEPDATSSATKITINQDGYYKGIFKCYYHVSYFLISSFLNRSCF